MERRLAAILVADMAGYSRLMEQDEEGVLTRQKMHRRELIDPEIAGRGGRIVKTTGDGMLAEFASAQDAVRCAIDIQTAMAERESASPMDRRIIYRVGINLGDVVFDEGDVFGDGVNVASRLQGLSEPGGVCISDIVHQSVADRFREPFRDMGRQRVKNISRPIRVWQWTPDAPADEPELAEAALHQRVQFATAPDGVQIAWATIGEGPPVLKAPNWLNHIEYEWRSPVWGPAFAELARHCRLVRFDQRGNGLSDWEVDEISQDAMIGDMATVARRRRTRSVRAPRHLPGLRIFDPLRRREPGAGELPRAAGRLPSRPAQAPRPRAEEALRGPDPDYPRRVGIAQSGLPALLHLELHSRRPA